MGKILPVYGIRRTKKMFRIFLIDHENKGQLYWIVRDTVKIINGCVYTECEEIIPLTSIDIIKQIGRVMIE